MQGCGLEREIHLFLSGWAIHNRIESSRFLPCKTSVERDQSVVQLKESKQTTCKEGGGGFSLRTRDLIALKIVLQQPRAVDGIESLYLDTTVS